MNVFIRISIFHLLAALVILQLFREEGVLGVLVPVAQGTARTLPLVMMIAIVLFVTGVATAVLFRSRLGRYREIVTNFGVALTATLMFHTAFTLIKTSIPAMVPFYADPYFAAFDKWLHGGVDPWVWTYQLAEYLPMDVVLTAYLHWWSIPILGFLMLLATMDKDEGRVRRFAVLYAVAWIFCGHVLATVGSSVGPVYYDRLLGGDRFADMMVAIEGGAVAGSVIEIVQNALWTFYDDGTQALGSGISAFPSVHLSSTMVLALYVYERFPVVGAALGVAMVAVIQFLSVYTGYHYAIDGYASILVMLGAYVWLRRREASRNEEKARDMGDPQPA